MISSQCVSKHTKHCVTVVQMADVPKRNKKLEKKVESAIGWCTRCVKTVTLGRIRGCTQSYFYCPICDHGRRRAEMMADDSWLLACAKGGWVNCANEVEKKE